MDRRQFLSLWMMPQTTRSRFVEVEVMEIFSTSDGPSALLVHHASEAARNTFSDWLRAKDGSPVVCQTRDGLTIDGRIFRVKMCFGRGLILIRVPIALRPKDILTVN
jgi:hypothetical protein